MDMRQKIDVYVAGQMVRIRSLQCERLSSTYSHLPGAQSPPKGSGTSEDGLLKNGPMCGGSTLVLCAHALMNSNWLLLVSTLEAEGHMSRWRMFTYMTPMLVTKSALRSLLYCSQGGTPSPCEPPPFITSQHSNGITTCQWHCLFKGKWWCSPSNDIMMWCRDDIIPWSHILHDNPQLSLLISEKQHGCRMSSASRTLTVPVLTESPQPKTEK